jgi:hypothetical protein
VIFARPECTHCQGRGTVPAEVSEYPPDHPAPSDLGSVPL